MHRTINHGIKHLVQSKLSCGYRGFRSVSHAKLSANRLHVHFDNHFIDPDFAADLFVLQPFTQK
jgi:hypothetical protein